MDWLPEILGMSTDYIWASFLVFLRIGAAVAVLPAFGEQALPMRIKLAASFAFTAVVIPATIENAEGLVREGRVLTVIGGEVIAGLVLGLFFRIFVLALQLAGSIAAQAISLSQLFGGTNSEPQPAFSTLLMMAGLCLAVIYGLHLRVAEGLLWSYELFPIGGSLDAGAVSEWGVDQVARCFALGFSLAGPFVLASLIYNLGLGVINKAMPQLMVAFVGAPAISLGGLVLLLLASPFLLSIWIQTFLEASDFRSGGFR